MAKKKVEEPTNELVVVGDTVPSYIKQDPDQIRGSEDVKTEDLTIPRLEVVQALSPIRKKNDPEYVEGAEEGILYNSVTRELYGESVMVVPIIFKKQWLIWKDRDAGGGFRGEFPNPEEADTKIVELTNDGDVGPFESVDTAQHLCLLLREDGRIEEIVLSMSKSKMKVSRQWNSIIRMIGGDRFSRVYNISSVEQKGEKGEFYNFHVTALGFPSQSVYERAENLYEEVFSGEREIRANQDDTKEEEVKEDQF